MEIESWSDYIDQATKTAKDQPAKYDLAHAVKGLDAEWWEFKYQAESREDHLDELGDLFWYLAIAWHAMQRIRERTDGMTRLNETSAGLPRRLAQKKEEPGEELVRNRGEMANIVESLVDQEDPITRQHIERLSHNVTVMYQALQAIYWKLPTHFEVLEANAEKLEDRHGGEAPGESGDGVPEELSSAGYDNRDKLDPGKVGGVVQPESEKDQEDE